jgi:hypothetical protein
VTLAHISVLKVMESAFLHPDGGLVELDDIILVAKICSRVGEYHGISSDLEFNDQDRRLYGSRFADADFVREQADIIYNFLAPLVAGAIAN